MSESRDYNFNRPVKRPDSAIDAQPNQAGLYEDSAQDPAIIALEHEVEAQVNQKNPSPTTADWEAGYRQVMHSGWLAQNRERALAYARRKAGTTQRTMVERMLVQELELAG